jgi:Ni2+-binding GTPase involved in maturation of urease and hydrogenase
VRRVNPKLEMLQLSATRRAGLDNWYKWLRRRAQA